MYTVGAGKQETSAGSYGIVAWASCGQEFVPSLSNLVAVEVRIYLAGSNPVVGVELALAVREGTITGTVVPGSQQSQYLSLGVGFEDWIRFDFAAPLSVLPGSKYVIQLAGAGQGSNLLSWTCSSSALSYLPGKQFYKETLVIGNSILLSEPMQKSLITFHLHRST